MKEQIFLLFSAISIYKYILMIRIILHIFTGIVSNHKPSS